VAEEGEPFDKLRANGVDRRPAIRGRAIIPGCNEYNKHGPNRLGYVAIHPYRMKILRGYPKYRVACDRSFG
jgi:hypothetical protein